MPKFIDPLLQKITPSLRPKIDAVIQDVRAKGYEAYIASALRSASQQADKVAKGYSKTKKSRHLPGKDGLARAADIVPEHVGWNADKRYWLMLGSSARAHGLGWGGLFGLNKGLKRFTKADTKAIIQAIDTLRLAGWPKSHPAYMVVTGWDPAHVQDQNNW